VSTEPIMMPLLGVAVIGDSAAWASLWHRFERYATRSGSITIAPLRPVLERTHPVTQLAEVHRVLESTETFGKIVVTWGALQ
jgi:hypothetical protein